MKTNSGYYNAFPLLSRGAIINFVVSLRNKGKTTTFLKRAYRRFVKHGYGTYWIRRTVDEKTSTKREFITPKRCKILGAKMEDFKLRGDTLLAKRGDKFHPFVRFLAVSAYRDERSADDSRFREMVFDEYQATPAEFRRYNGNEAQDFFDLFISKKRDGKMKVFFLGNKESYANPYHRYFGIPEISDKMDGFYIFAGGGICLEVNNDPAPENKNAYESKLAKIIENTPYKNYMYAGETKNALTANIAKLPKVARHYCNIDFGSPFTISVTENGFHFHELTDTKRRILVDDIHRASKYRDPIIFTAIDKKRFDRLILALKQNRVFFTTPAIAENAVKFFQKIGVPM